VENSSQESVTAVQLVGYLVTIRFAYAQQVSLTALYVGISRKRSPIAWQVKVDDKPSPALVVSARQGYGNVGGRRGKRTKGGGGYWGVRSWSRGPGDVSAQFQSHACEKK